MTTPHVMGLPDPESLPEGTRRVFQDAHDRSLDIELVTRPPARSLEEAAGSLGIPVDHVVKSLVARQAEGRYLFALIPGGRKISWPKLRAVIGVNRVTLPDATEALAATGYERGTITPLGSTTAWPVYADASIAGKRVSLGAGAHGWSVLGDADALTTALGATVADISEPE